MLDAPVRLVGYAHTAHRICIWFVGGHTGVVMSRVCVHPVTGFGRNMRGSGMMASFVSVLVASVIVRFVFHGGSGEKCWESPLRSQRAIDGS
jgi:hypothetical protein